MGNGLTCSSLLGCSDVCRGAVLCLVHISGINIVAEERSATVGEHLLECCLRGVCCHGACVNGVVQFHTDAVGAVVCDVCFRLAVQVCCIADVSLAVNGHQPVVIYHAFPVVVGCVGTRCRDVVAFDVVAAGIPHVWRALGGGRCCHRNLCDACLIYRCLSCLVVVVHYVYLSASGAAVASVAVAPVVHHAVAEIHTLCLNGVAIGGLVVAVPVVACPAEAWCSVLHVCYEVVVERSVLSSPDSSVTMFVLGVSGICKSLAEGAPLHGEVAVVVERCYLVNAPREGAVVENDVVLFLVPDGVSTVVDVLLFSSSYANEAYDVVVSGAHCEVAHGNAGVGCCLSLDGGIVADDEVASQFDNTRHVEHYNLLAVPVYRCSERAGAAVVEVCDVYNRSSASSGYVTSESLGSGECRCLCHCYCRAQHGGK